VTGAKRTNRIIEERSHHMPRKPWTNMLRTFDTLALGLAILIALAISSRTFEWPSFAYLLVIRIKIVNLLFLLGYLAFAQAVFTGCGFYRSHRFSSFGRRLTEVALAAWILTSSLFLLRWPLEISFATDEFLLMVAPILFLILAATREIGHWALYVARSRGKNLRNVVVVGEGREALALADRMQREAGLGYRVVRVIDVKEVQRHDRVTGAL
jgi:FlaA1/EpsC-like NDP-sugar epimerase